MEDYLTFSNVKYLRMDGILSLCLFCSDHLTRLFLGSTKSEERGELLAKFNADDCEYAVFILRFAINY